MKRQAVNTKRALELTYPIAVGVVQPAGPRIGSLAAGLSMSDSETIPANYGSNGPMQPPTALAVSDPMQFSTQLLDERWGHSGRY